MFLSTLEPLDPFPSIDFYIFYGQATYLNAEFTQADYDNDNEDEWVSKDSFEERNIFEILDDEILY